jgi:hypothetical protein
MQLILIAFTSMIGLILAFYNAWIFAMSSNRDAYYNKLVHRAGGAIRFTWVIFIIILGVFLEIPFESLLFVLLIAGILFFPFYNIVYNSFNHENWFYVGSSASGTKSFMDKYFGKFYIPSYFILIFLAVFWYPLNLYDFFTITLIQALKERWLDFTIAAMLAIFTTAVVLKFRKSKPK